MKPEKIPQQTETETETETEAVVPVIDEDLATGVRRVKTGSVRVDKRVEREIRKIAAPLLREEVEVRHVPVNRIVNEAPPVRTRGGTVIVPVVEEELVVTKRLVLKEEIHLIKRRTRERSSQEVEVQHETAEVRRLDSEGRVIDPEPGNAAPAKPRRWRSVLD